MEAQPQIYRCVKQEQNSRANERILIFGNLMPLNERNFKPRGMEKKGQFKDHN